MPTNCPKPRGTRRLQWVMAVLLVTGLIVTATSCSNSALTVTTSSQIGALPVSAEGVWHDLERLSLDTSRRKLAHVFSSRHLIHRVTGVDSGQPPGEVEQYEALVRNQVAELKAVEEQVGVYSDRVRDILRRLLRAGTTVTHAPEYPPPGIKKNRDQIPIGPNRCYVLVEYWRESVGVGEAIAIELEFVQEQMQWKLDSLSPDPFADPPEGKFKEVLDSLPQTGRRRGNRDASPGAPRRSE